MDIDFYFEPCSEIELSQTNPEKRIGSTILSFSGKNKFPLLKKADIAIIGVKDDRRALNNYGCGNAPDFVRQYFYNLFPAYNWKINIIDLGNIINGNKVEDTYFALKSVVAELINLNILPIIIGGGQDLTYANYLAYESLKQIINIVAIDSMFNIGSSDEETNSDNYLSKIIVKQPSFLFNFTNIGYQTYLVDKEAIDLLKNLYFDTCRLGNARASLEDIEPMIRNADMLSFDISAIRHSDAPGNANASPNGFYGEEACQLIRYAGLSDKLTSLGLYEINPSLDNNNITSSLVSQMIWYFIDGYANRKNIVPQRDKDNFLKFFVPIRDNQYEIVFYKNDVTNQWWMEIPCSSNTLNKYDRHYLVPCSYKDYQTACNDELPDRWWMMFQKLI